jgi:NAD(P)-dependent dehydrogenase (short-subunit alcohol dehydrogenase family)
MLTTTFSATYSLENQAMAMLQGRRAVVTGGGSGIGRATAVKFGAEGARVCVADLNGGAAESVAKEIDEAGGEAFAVTADVTSVEANDAMVAAAVERFGGVDVAYLNAGIAVGSTILEGDLDAWNQVVAVNLSGVFFGMRAVAPAMIAAGGGSIVVTASVAGLRGGAGMPSYYATKHGVVGLMKAAATEFAEHQIRVNAVCPGVIDTPILGPVHGVKAITQGILAKGHLLGRVGEAPEVAALVAFLASDQAAFITGSAYPIDGGMTAAIGIGADAENADPETQALLEKMLQKE